MSRAFECNDPHRPALGRPIDQAAAGGIDAKAVRPDLVVESPFADEYPARSLDLRLVDPVGDVTRPATNRPAPIGRGNEERPPPIE